MLNSLTQASTKGSAEMGKFCQIWSHRLHVPEYNLDKMQPMAFVRLIRIEVASFDTNANFDQY
jgi:hypothetical protein